MKKSLSKAAQVKLEVQEKITGYITAGFGLVASLAWNEAIKGLIAYIYPAEENSLIAKFMYAAVLTLVVVVISLILVRLQRKQAE
jgi:hypothetical protein